MSRLVQDRLAWLGRHRQNGRLAGNGRAVPSRVTPSRAVRQVVTAPDTVSARQPAGRTSRATSTRHDPPAARPYRLLTHTQPTCVRSTHAGHRISGLHLVSARQQTTRRRVTLAWRHRTAFPAVSRDTARNCISIYWATFARPVRKWQVSRALAYPKSSKHNLYCDK